MTKLVQKSNDIVGYFTKLKRLWDNLDSLNSHILFNSLSVWERKQKMVKSFEVQTNSMMRVYAQIKGNVLMMNSLLVINHDSFLFALT